ncbi:probable indole-3-pyruvate monooxygenase YUCCA7 [Olea europaea var. sylvestris]|uniref:probable indole-3-pyruvate monooxygenase YUCCA7 n=1 Tax=Olea europaea var. sylvestris TaxID=158386 RepID=UPI000C1D73A6|nr:probable indole-3-pyruvate monooxygenase YUCCA7 [Olea europaea var. sylvestris]
MVVQSSVHVSPRDSLGKSTFDLAVSMKWLPIWAIDKVLLAAVRLILGNIEQYESLESRIFSCQCIINGKILEIDYVILVTGYCNNVPSWLKENEFFSMCMESPKSAFPNGWKGKFGLFVVGFIRRGLSGASLDAIKVAQDIGNIWKKGTKQKN